MTIMCMFCGIRSESDVEHVCGNCVQLLLAVDQEDLKRAHQKALDKGYESKADAIKSFLIMEETDGKRSKRVSNRKRTDRPVRRKERISRQVTQRQEAALL